MVSAARRMHGKLIPRRLSRFVGAEPAHDLARARVFARLKFYESALVLAAMQDGRENSIDKIDALRHKDADLNKMLHSLMDSLQ